MNARRTILALAALAWACARPAPSAVPAVPVGGAGPVVRVPAPAPEPRAPAPEPEVPTGINDDWRGSDVAPLVARLESESREIWIHRDRLIEVVGPRPGTAVADVGAGSGFLTLALARRVGPAGTVYAVDINPTLLARVAEQARRERLTNVRTLLAEDRGTPLSPGSVDLILLCDAYHHFEAPRATLRGLHEALRPGGELVLVDFERIPGKTPAWMLGHVRAGKEVFAAEVVEAGFELVGEHDVPELRDNYVLRFRKRPPNASAVPYDAPQLRSRIPSIG